MQPLVSLRILTTPYSLFEIADLTSGKAAAKNKLETRLSHLLLYECHNIAATSFHRHYIFLNLTRFRLFFLGTSLCRLLSDFLLYIFPPFVLVLSQELPVISRLGQGNRLHGMNHHDRDTYRLLTSGIVCNAYFTDILHICSQLLDMWSPIRDFAFLSYFIIFHIIIRVVYITQTLI